jgi:hypothetical protein
MQFTPNRFGTAVALAVATAVACGGSDLLLPGDSQPASLAIVQGNNQSARVGESLAQPITVRVSDGAGRPVAQARVLFAASAGPGATITPASDLTGNDGQASAQWSLGPTAGAYAAEVRVDGSAVEPARFTAFAAAGVAARVVLSRGDGQMAPVGTVLPDSLVVRATDASGNPVEGIGVTWTPIGGGSVSEAATATDAAGLAGVARTLGTTAGSQTTLAAVPGVSGSPVTFAATATSGSAGRLRLTVQPSASAVLGIPFARQPRVQLLDNLDNVVPQAGRAVSVAIATGPAGATLLGQHTRETDGSGLAAFTDLAVSGPAGTYTLSFAGADLALVTSASIALTSGQPNASRSRVDAEPETFPVAGGTSSVTVTALDDLGNPVGNAAAVATVDRPGDATLQPGTRTTDENGRAAFTLTVKKAGRYIVGGRINTIELLAKDTVTAVRISSTTTITSNHAQPVQVLTPITVSWSVSSAQPSRLTGSVTVSENGQARCTGALSGTCGFTPSTVGERTITVTYPGDDAHQPSSDSRSQLVQAIPTQLASLTSSPNPATTKDQVTFEAGVSAVAGTPQGTVAFTIGVCGGAAQALGTAVLNNGVARLTRKLESVGTFCVAAAYQGSTVHGPSQSVPPGLVQVVTLRR